MASPTLTLSPALTQKLKSAEAEDNSLDFCLLAGASNTNTTVDPILNPAICKLCWNKQTNITITLPFTTRPQSQLKQGTSSPFLTTTPVPSGS
jgi:hypothetical protein